MYIKETEKGRKFKKLKEGTEEWQKVFPYDSRMGENLESPKDTEPTLLLIHGTNGSAKIAFQGLIDDQDSYDLLRARYGERIFAFQHPSVFQGVNSNVKQLLEHLKNIRMGPIDIVTRSRGGLIARWLLEKRDFNEKPDFNYIRRVVMLAPLNQGTQSSTGFLNQWRTAVYVTPKLRTLYRDMGDKRRDGLDEEEILKEIVENLEIDLSELIHLLGRNNLIQGAQDQAIDSEIISALNNSTEKKENLPVYYSIMTALDLRDDYWGPRTDDHLIQLHNLRELLKKTFGEEPNDGINPSRGAFSEMTPDDSPRINLNYKSKYLLKSVDSRHATHLNYMDFTEVHQAILYYLNCFDSELPLSPEIASISGVLGDNPIDQSLNRLS